MKRSFYVDRANSFGEPPHVDVNRPKGYDGPLDTKKYPMEKSDMLTIELRDAAKASEGMAEVEVFCDSEGLDLLARQIDSLRSGSTHAHLMTPAWAGNELGETPVGRGTTLVNHLRITMLPKRP